ncbi:zincin-like metallopeptidase domain-containing protein [Paenibacillus polysaccharolyticus]|uniref:ArdC family protein n=1 Tax=Paenibacillus TaxID=44249 RepID=UPI0008D291EE|nr:MULTISPECIES: zincin-like metallopeptidase domain-containing protein [Paenibacillus]MCP1137532.1 zincin-like metallopeptidase domain-containing protein [Paenibacillus polysaccharolyticus]SEP33634.1 Antirestriction protein ArdC [Paenibacillus sp. OK076]
MPKKKEDKKTVYDIVTERILNLLAAGVVPWRRPWRSGAAVNWRTQKPYRGINAMLLDVGEYATFKQITEAGGTVKKGTKAEIVVFWKWLDKKNEETGEDEKIPLLRYYKVFNIAGTGLESKRAAASPVDHDPIEDAERLVSGYTDRPPIRYASGRAFYRPSEDVVSVPPLVDYQQAEEYYCTLFHELVHSTGHSKRLKRPLDEIAAFGDEVYSREELIAEMGAAMLCGVAKIDNHTIENSASYINGWVRKIQEDDKRLVVQAAGIAQRAADYIQGISYEQE